MKKLNSVMVVEDDPDIREIVTMALESIGGYAVTTCANGEEAIAAIRAQRPDLVLLDWMMPGMDGLKVLAKLRARPETSDLPVVFMSAKVRPEEISRMRELGASDVISKPFDPLELPDRLARIWGQAHE